MCSVFGEKFVGVRVSGHILFAVFRLPFGCKIPPHHRRNIINAKKITFDGRTQPPTRTPTASKRTPASREPCAVFRLSASRERVSASGYPHTPPKPTPNTRPQWAKMDTRARYQGADKTAVFYNLSPYKGENVENGKIRKNRRQTRATNTRA